ncbi:D-isomer specific 2-hydroxyacid dehydrogenase family protein [Kribbella sp. NPDC048915]|uniref:D-isomer specific 2-hydroxyacid dehydrogenase family protein n=1 Tax=Kribbella sp. NPDC048915 TaxID=3155148 RepID=UPI0033FACC99
MTYAARIEAPSVEGLTTIAVFGCEPDEAAVFRELAGPLRFVPLLTADPVEVINVDLAAGSRCISIGHKTPVTRGTLRALRRAGVRYISTRSIGCNHLDVKYAEHLGLRVENVSYSPDSVADFTVLLMLMAIRHIRSILRRTDVHDYRLDAVRGRELRDLTVGVVGTGRIGTAVIDRLRGFGCRVVAYDKYSGDLEAVLRQSDVVTLHTPLTARTHHLLDRRRIAQLKPGAFVINTGRGGLIDTPALVDALEGGRLGGAALDVLEGEEGIFYVDRRHDPIDNDLLLRLHRLPTVVISPHTAYYTDHALRDTVENSVRNCLNFVKEHHG